MYSRAARIGGIWVYHEADIELLRRWDNGAGNGSRPEIALALSAPAAGSYSEDDLPPAGGQECA